MLRRLRHGAGAAGQQQEDARLHEQREARPAARRTRPQIDRKSTRLNSSHPSISYAVFCLKKKKKKKNSKTKFKNSQLLNLQNAVDLTAPTHPPNIPISPSPTNAHISTAISRKAFMFNALQ